LAAALDLSREADREVVQGGFDEYWELLRNSDEGRHKRIRRSFKRLTGERGAAARILSGRDEDYSKEKAEAEGLMRLKWLWKALGLPASARHGR
jgi:hypothetical protein